MEVREGSVRRRSTLRLSEEDLAHGYALACQTLVNSDATIWIPPEHERLELLDGGHRPTRPPSETVLCDHHARPWVVALPRGDAPRPRMDDNIPDLERLQRELTRQFDLPRVSPSLTALSNAAPVIREEDWAVTAEVERFPSTLVDRQPTGCWTCCLGEPGRVALGLAVDIGTTTVEAYLGDLATGD